MSRYEATPDKPGDLGLFVHDHEHTELGGIGPVYSEAEAHIIAFALNAVAGGGRLTAFYPFVNKDHGLSDRYDGPTEGVATNGGTGS